MGTRKILKNKYYLYLTEFFSGMSVMAVELAASRLLAPYFSSSQIVWTIIIGTIMIAMALGNLFGGKNADKNPNPDRLYRRLLVAALWIAAIPALGKYLILGVSAVLITSLNRNLLIWAAFLSCLTIFVFPTFLLGTVTPSLAKYAMESLKDSGRTVGTLGAFQTIGSIIGTFVPTFVTIPAAGTSVTFLIFSGILLLLSLVYFISVKAEGKKCVFGILLFILFSILGHSDKFAFWEKSLLYEGESVYNYLQVKENEESLVLSTNVLFGVQSIMKKGDGLTGMYYDYALAAAVMAESAQKQAPSILILGMGTGTYARQCLKYFEGADVEGVEIDARITQLAEKYFKLPKNVKVTTYDGRAYLDVIEKNYNVIMVDAFQDITIPFQMSTKEFFTKVEDHLTDGGIMVVNLNMGGDQEGSISQYLSDTISSIFDAVYTVDVQSCTNRVLFAGRDAYPMETFGSKIREIKDQELKRFLRKIEKRIKPYEGGTCLLTDDKAPVEVLGMKALDELISHETGYYRQILKEKGLYKALEAM